MTVAKRQPKKDAVLSEHNAAVEAAEMGVDAPEVDAPEKELTEQEERFVTECFMQATFTQAYINAGYTTNNAGKNAHKLAKRPHIAAEIKRRLAKFEKGDKLRTARTIAAFENIVITPILEENIKASDVINAGKTLLQYDNQLQPDNAPIHNTFNFAHIQEMVDDIRAGRHIAKRIK